MAVNIQNAMLPTEVLHRIFNFAEEPRVREVCQFWKEAEDCRACNLWERVKVIGSYALPPQVDGESEFAHFKRSITSIAKSQKVSLTGKTLLSAVKIIEETERSIGAKSLCKFCHVILTRHAGVFDSVPGELSDDPLAEAEFWRSQLRSRAKEVTHLNLSSFNLNLIPKEITLFSSLKRLNLNDNQLTSLPDNMGSLTSLKGLSLQNNQLTALPDTIGNLLNLTMLSLRDNSLRALPDSMGSLRNLTELYLDNNKLTALPGGLGSLTSLTKLYLTNNELTDLPETIGRLTSLTELFLDKNELTDLPDSMKYLTNLTRLDLDGNKLTAPLEGMESLTNLRRLYLNSNEISTLPDSIAVLRAHGCNVIF